MDKLKRHTGDVLANKIDELAALFPTIVTETRDEGGHLVRAVDYDLLRQELADHVVEGPQERYQLNWPGKRDALFAANAPIAKTLRPLRDESVNFDTTRNLFIEGDNLDVLKLLQESYLGQFTMIYIDPPYNTGRDFVYRDDFTANTAEYLALSGQSDDAGARLVANTESNGRFHSDWLTMMYPRLKLARNLLARDGVIFMSIDDGELVNLVKLCNEVFGEANRVATFVWKSKSGGANDSGAVAVDHEYIVCFARTIADLQIGPDPEGEATTSYNLADESGRYALERLDKQNLQYSPSLDYDLVGPGGAVYKLSHRDPRRPNAVWRWSRDRVERERDRLVFKDGSVYTKNYEKAGTKPRSLFVDERFGRTRTGSTELRDLIPGDVFDNPKPTKLIEVLVNIATHEDSAVLDFFAGSGTTAHAVMKVNQRDGGNRRWALVQLPESVPDGSAAREAGFGSIPQIARQRIIRAGESILENSGELSGATDVGFRTLRVDTTNMADIRRAPDELGQDQLDLYANSVKEDRTGEDLLFQVLLDWGLELTLPIAVETIGVKEVYSVDDGALIACFDAGITPALVREIAKRQPLRAVFLDSSFASDADRINTEQIFAELSPATDVKAI